MQQVTSRPAWCDLGRTRELHVGCETGRTTTDLVDVLLDAITILHDLLMDKTSDGQRNFTIALTSGCGFKFCNTFFEVGAAVPPEIGSRRATCSQPTCEQAGNHEGAEAVLIHLPSPVY